MSDELCVEHGLTVIKNPKGKTPRSIYFAEKNGEPTAFNLMREAIDYAIDHSLSFSEFRRIMSDQGYIVNLNPSRTYWTIRSVNSKKCVRMVRLGKEYENKEIQRRIYERDDGAWQRNREYYRDKKLKRDFRPQHIVFRGSLKRMKRYTGIYATYLHYIYLMGKLPKRSRRKPLSPEMREAWRHLDRFSRQVTLISHKSLNTLEDVENFIRETDQSIGEVTDVRSKLYNKLRRCNNDNKRTELLKRRDECTAVLKQLRKEKRIAKTVIEDYPKTKENIRIETQAQNLARGIKQKSKQRSYNR